MGGCLEILIAVLLNEPVEAWRYGPVVPSVYHTYKSFRGSAITTPTVERTDRFDHNQDELIKVVVDAYADYTPLELSTITHQAGTPWQQVYRDGRGERTIIPNELIQSYYKLGLEG